MQSAEAMTPAPTYGTSASSRKPCTVPSSPKGPCRTGKTTSTSASVAGTFDAGTGSDSLPVSPPRSRAALVAGPISQRPSRPISTATVS